MNQVRLPIRRCLMAFIGATRAVSTLLGRSRGALGFLQQLTTAGFHEFRNRFVYGSRHSKFRFAMRTLHHAAVYSLVLLMATAGTPMQARAANYFWDPTLSVSGSIGGSGTWDTTTPNWFFGGTDTTWPNSLVDTAIFGGNTGGIVNVASGINVGRLSIVNPSYNFTGGDITLGTGIIQVDAPALLGGVAQIDSLLLGTSGLSKNGLGTLVLTGANQYTGQTTIESGTLVITNGLALGSDPSTVVVNGFANRAAQGGQLIVAGNLSSATSVTFARNLSLVGRGSTGDGAALLSLGNTLFTGNIFLSSASETRIGSAYGTATFSGNIDLPTNTSNVILVGNGNFVMSGLVGGYGNNAQVSLDKTGNGTLILSGTNNNNLARWQIDAGSIRVANGLSLGVSVRPDSVIPNAGFLEVRSDVGNTFSNVLLTLNNAALGLLVDRGISATGSLNQTIAFGNMASANNLVALASGRNGTNLFVPLMTAGGGANGVGTTWSGNGLLTMGTYTGSSTGTSQGITITTTGDALVTGSFGYIGSGATPNFNKAGGGMLTLLGSTSTTTATVPFTVANGTLSVASLMNLSTTGAAGGINIGAAAVTGAVNFLGAGGGALYGGTGAGETDTRVLNINGTANNILFANQTGSAPSALTISNLTSTATASVSTLYLAGSSTLLNTISSAIPANAAGFGIAKSGTGTWVLSGNNLYTGLTAVYGGTLIIDASSATGTSTKLSDTGAIVFNADATGAAASATANTGGWTAAQTAGGTFIYKGNSAAAGSQELLGALTASAGSGNVTIDSSSGAGTTLTFASMGTRSANATLNITPNAGAIKFTGAVGATTTIVGGYAVLNGNTAPDFMVGVAAGGSVVAPSYGSGNFLALPSSGGVATVNYLSDGSTSTTGTILANSLKIKNSGAVTGTGSLTITSASATSLGGILFDNSAGAGSISGFTGITTSTANQELIFYTGGSTSANALTVSSPLANGTGSITKAGSGTMILSGNSSGFSGNVFINEGTLTASGTVANLFGSPAVTSTISVRQTATLDLGGSGFATSLYGTTATVPLLTVGALQGGGANSVLLAATTTASAAALNTSTITVASATGLAVGQTVTGTGIGGYPTIVSIVGTSVTLSSPVTISSGTSLAFSSNVTTGATITNSGGASAISLGIPTSTGTTVYTGLIKDGAGATTVVVAGAAARFQTLTGYNTYTGATIISGGATLRLNNLANGGVASAIGASTNAAANLVFNNGILQYTGGTTTLYQNTSTPSVAIDRLFTIAGAATIDSSGTVGANVVGASGADNAALVFSNTGAVSYVGTTAAARTLTLTGGSIGDNEIDLQLINNGSTTNSLGVTKAGNSLWILGNGSNTYTGLTTITAGQLRATDGASLPTLSPLVLNGGVLETSGTFSRTLLATAPTATSAAGGIYWSAGGGFAASTAKLTVTLNGGTPMLWAGPGFVPNGSALILGSTTSLFETEFKSNIDLNATTAVTRSITTTDNANTGNDFVTISGNISNSTPANLAGLTIAAGVPTIFSGANTYNGATTISAGELRVLSLGNSLTNPTGSSSVGTPSASVNSAIIFGNTTTTGATLTYVGAGEVSDRALTSLSTTGGIVLDASGSGPLVLTGTFTNNNAALAAKTLSLNGLNTDLNTIVSVLTNNTAAAGGALSVTKNIGGTWVLAGANTYTGATAVNGGVLGAGNNSAFGTGTVTITNATIMAVGDDRTLANNLVLANNTTNAVMGSNSLTFNGTFTWGSAGGANNVAFTNNITSGKSFTMGSGFNNVNNAATAMTINGTGATVVNGAMTQVNSVALTYSGASGGSLTFGGSGDNTVSGTFTQSSGTVIINRTGAFSAFSNYAFNAGYLQSTSAAPLTGSNALIPALLTTGTNAGQPGILNLGGASLYLIGTGSIEVAGQFNNSAGNRTLYNNLSGGASLILSGAVNLSNDGTARIFTLGGTGNTTITGPINLSLIGTATSGTFIKNNTGDLNIVPTTPPVAPIAATLTINGGSVTFDTASTNTFSFNRIDVNAGGTLNLDNSTNNVVGRIGSGSNRQLSLNGGTLNFTANAAGTAENVGYLYLGSATNQSGGGTINFVNGGSANSSLSFTGFVQNNFTSLNVVASSLATTNKIFLPGIVSTGAFGLNPRILINGTEFATNGVGGLQAYSGYFASNNLDGTQTLSTLPQLDNFALTSNATFTGATITGQNKTVNGLKISGNGTTLNPTGLFTLTVNGGGVLATGTGNTIGGAVLNFGATEGIFHVVSGADLTVNAALVGTVGFTKADAGTLTLVGPVYTTGGFAVNGGTLKMGSSFQSLPTITTPTVQSLIINGGTFDLNGFNQTLGNLVAIDPNQGAAGNITNSSATAATLYVLHASAQTYGGSMSGNMSYNHMGNVASTFAGPSSFTGSTTVSAGSVVLRDGGTFSGTTQVNVNFSTLQFDNTGLSDLSSRINATAPVTLNGGTILLTGAVSGISQQAMGVATAQLGLSTLSAAINGSGGAFLMFGGLNRAPGTMVNFTGTSLGLLYNTNANSPRITIAGQTSGFIGGWATVGGTEFASYISGIDTSVSPNISQGVSALQTYTLTAENAWAATDTVKIINGNTAANPFVFSLTANRIINAINLQATTNPITLNNAGFTLSLASGGLLYNGVDGGTLSGGSITAANNELFVYANNSLTISSQLTGANLSVVLAAPAKTLTLSPTSSNAYGSTSGTTYFNGGTLTFGSGAGITAIPTNLVVNNAAVTFTQLGQLGSGKNLTINGSGGAVTFIAGQNNLGAVTFNNVGGNTTPQITGGTISMASLTAVNDNLTTTPTIASIVNLNGSNLSITTSGLSSVDLSITGQILDNTSSLTTGLLKSGVGSLVLNNANSNFGGGVSLAANGGTLIVDVSSTPTSGTVTAGPLGVGALTLGDNTSLMSGTAVRTLANTVNINGNISLGGVVAANNIVLTGLVAFGSGSRSITVTGPNASATLSGTMSGSQPFGKSGLGTLILTGSTINYAPGINVTAGVLSLDQTLQSFSAPITVAAPATVNLNVSTAGNIGVTVNPSGTPFAISGAGQLTKTGTAAVNVYGNFTYLGPTTVQSGSLLLTPNAITNAAPVFSGSSMVNLGGILSVFGLDNSGATGFINVGGGTTAINFLARDGVVSTTRNADFGSSLNLGGVVTRSFGATGIFNFINNVAFQTSPDDSIIGSNKIFVGGSTGVIDQGIYITSGNYANTISRTDFAYRDATGFVRSAGYGVDASTYLGNGSIGISATSGNFKITGNVSPTANLVAGSGANTLLLAGMNPNVTLATGSNVVNGILRTGVVGNPTLSTINGAPFFASPIATIQGGSIDNGGRELVIRSDLANDWLVINSTIMGSAGGLTKVGAGPLVIGGSAANTYSGNTNLLGTGTIYLNKTSSVTAIGGNVMIGDATSALSVQFGLMNNYSTTSLNSNNPISTSSVVTFNSSSTLSLNGASQTLAGLQTLSGNPVIQNGLAAGNATSTLTINNASDFNLGAGSTIRDASAQQYANLAFVKQGTGKLTVGIIANTGGVDIQGGILAIGAATAPGQVAAGTGAATLGTGFLNIASGATLDLNGFDYTGDSLTGAGTVINSGAAAKTLTIGNLDNTNMSTGAAVSALWSGTINDGLGAATIVLQKRGHGAQTINTVQGFSGGLAVLGGTLTLDMSGLGNPNNILRASNTLSLAGNLTIKGAATGTSSQTFASTALLSGASDLIVNSNGGTSTTLTLGTITRNANGTLNFGTTSAANVITFANPATNGILGTYATYNGTDWAMPTTLAAGGVTAYNGYTVGLPVTGGSATANYSETSTTVTLTGGVALNSLKLAPSGATQTIALGANVLTFGSTVGGILFDGANGSTTITGSATGQFLGNTGTTSELIITTNHSTGSGNPLTISAVIGGGATPIATVTKAGSDTLVLGANNTFAGKLVVNEGTVSFGSVAATGTAQPLGQSSIVLGGTSKTATLNYTGATATTWTQTISLFDGGMGQFSLTNAALSTLTIGGIISGGGGLTILTPTTSGSGLILSGVNTYLGQTIIQSGAKINITKASGLGANGTIANATIVQSGGTLDIGDNVSLTELLILNGTGVGGLGAVTYSGATTDLGTTMKSVILNSNTLVAQTGGKQLGFANGFIQGNGNTLTVNSAAAYVWFTNETIDNLPTVSVTGNVVVEQMTFGGGASQNFIMTGSAKQIQFRDGVIDRAVSFTGGSGSFTTSTRGGDNSVSQNITMNNSAATTLTLQAGTNATITINGNILQTGGGNAVVSRTGGFVVLGGTGNTFAGGITSTGAGTLKLMPIAAGAVANPFVTTNVVTFTGSGTIGTAYPNGSMFMILDNSKTGGALSQTFSGTLIATASAAPTIFLNNATGQNLQLAFSGTFTRPVGTLFYTGITGNFTSPSATNRIDIAGITGVNAGVFWGATDYAFRDISGGAGAQYLRPINYGVDAGTNLVGATASIATLVNTGAATNYTDIKGSVTAQATASIGVLRMSAGGASLTIGTGNTLTIGGGTGAAGNNVGILKTGGGAAAVISGGTALQFGGVNTTEAIIRTVTFDDKLTINTPITFFSATGQILNKYGQGRLTIGGTVNSTFTAGVGVYEGTLRVTNSSAQPLGVAANTVTVNQLAAFELDGTSGNITIPNAMTIGVSSGNSPGYMFQNTGVIRNIAGSNTINGALTSAGYVRINSDAGTLTLTNAGSLAAPVFGGVTAAPGGIAGDIVITKFTGNVDFTKDGNGKLTLAPTASLSPAAKQVGVQGGTLILDFTSMVTPTNLLASTEILNSLGGAIQILGKTGATATTQTFTTFTQRDGITRFSANANTGPGVTLTLGAYAVPTGFGTVDFLPGSNVTYSATAGGAAVNNNGILGTAAINGFATAGNDWAVINGTTILNYVTNGGVYTALPASGASATTNYNLTSNQTVTTTQALNSLKYDTTGGALQLTVSPGQQLNTNAQLVAGTNNVTLTGGGLIGSTTATNYLQIQGSGNVVLDTPLADNSVTASTAWVIAGTGTGGLTITSSGAINFASNANTDSLYFEGGTPALIRTISNAGAINFNSKGTFDIAHVSNDTVEFTNTGVINLTAGTFNVGNTASAYGSYIQNGTSSVFTANGAAVQFAASTTGSITNSTGFSAGSASFTMNAGTFAVGGTTGAGNATIFGGAGRFVGNQNGGVITLNRPGNVALFVGQDGTYGATSSFSVNAGTFSVNGATLIGGRNGANGNFSVTGTGTANFYQGLVIGLQDFAQGTFTQTGGTVNIGTGQNISDGTYLKGGNAFDLSLGYNQTTNAGVPSTTKGVYNLNGGTLRVNGVTTGQGNGYTSGSNADPSTFSDANTVTTTTGGTALFNLGGGTLSPFDSELSIATGVVVTLTASGSTVLSTDKAGIGRLVSFNTPIGESGGSQSLMFDGLGASLLNASNTFTGGLTIAGGLVRVGNSGALNSTSPNSVAFGAAAGSTAGLQLNGFSVTIGGLSTNAIPGTPFVENSSSTNAVLTVASTATQTYAGTIRNGTGSGTISLTKTGTGFLTLAGTNTYTGPTTISGTGGLFINGSLQGTGVVSVGPSAALGGSGNIAGATIVANLGIIQPGDVAGAAAVGPLTLSGLTFTNTATVNFAHIQDGALATLLNAGALTLNGGTGSVTLNVGAGNAAWSNTVYPLITYTGGTIQGAGFAGFVLANPSSIPGLSSRQSASLSDTGTAVNLVISGDSPRWSGFDTTGAVLSTAWKPNDATLTNWTLVTGGTPTSFLPGDQVLFDDVIHSGATGTVDISNGNVTPSAVTFNNTLSGVAYALTSSTTDGITGSTGIVKNNTGSLTINNANTFTGGLTINGGLVTFGNASAIGSTNVVSFGTASNGTLRLNDNSIGISGLTGDATAIVENGGSVADATLSIALATTNIFAGTLGDGSGGKALRLVKTGIGNLVLTGADSYTGGTTISGGALQIGNNGTTGSFVGNVLNNGTLVFNRSDSVSYSGIVTGSGTVSIATGTLILTGQFNNTNTNTVSLGATLQVGDGVTNGSVGNLANSGAVNVAAVGNLPYAGTITGTGTVTVASGTLVLTGGLNNTGASTIASGATLQVGNGTDDGTLGGDIVDNGTLKFLVPTAAPLVYGGAVSGTGSVTVSNFGSTVILTGGSSYGGGTTVDAGATLQIGNNTTTGSISGDVIDNGALVFARSNGASYTGTISGGGALYINGTGTLTLSPGAAANSYSSGTFVQRGTLKLGATDVLPTSGALTIGNPGLAGTLDLNAFNQTVASLATLGVASSQTIVNNSTIANSILTLNGAGTSTFGGAIKDGASKKVGLIVTGGGTLVLSGAAAASTFTLSTAVQQGTFKIGANAAGTLASAITLGSGASVGIFDLNGFNGSVGGLAVDPTVVSAAAQLVGNSGSTLNTLTLTVPAATTNVFSGTIQDTLNLSAGSLALTVTNNATGVQALTGTNTYSGATNITSGTLQIGANTTTGTLGTSNVTNAGILLFNRSNAYALSASNIVTGAGAVTLATGTVATAIDGQFNTTGTLNFGAAAGAATSATLDLSNGSSTFGGMLVRTNSTSPNNILIGSGKALNITGSGNFDVQAPTASGTAALTVSGGGTLNVNTTGSFLLDAATVATPNVVVDFSGLSTFTSTTGIFAVGQGNATAGVTATLNLAASNTITNSGIFYVGRSASGVAGNSGTLRLGQANVINSGVAGTSPIMIGTDKANGTVIFNSGLTNPTLTIRGSAGGSTPADLNIGVQLNTTGTGIVGNVLLTAGAGRSDGSINALLTTLKIGEGSNGSTAGTGAGTLEFDQGTVTAANVILGSAVTASVAGSTGTGTLNIGGGTLNVGSGGMIIGSKSGGAANAVGVLNITGGLVLLSSAGITTGGAGTGTATSTVNLNGGTLDLNGNSIGAAGNLITNVTLAAGTLQNVGQINNGAVITKTTAGTLTLAGNNTYTGATTISAGVLQISSETNLGTSPVAFTAGQLTINGGTLASTATFAIDDTTRGITLGSSGATIQTALGTTLTVATAVAGPSNASLTKTGDGTLIISSPTTYTGATAVNQGTLISPSTGGITNSSSITVNNHGTFIGEGTVAGPMIVASGGSIVAGTSATNDSAGIGKLTDTATGNALMFLGGSAVTFAFSANDAGTQGSDWSLFDLTAGRLSLAADGTTSKITINVVSLATNADPLSTPGTNTGANQFDPNTTTPYHWLFVKGASTIDTSGSTNFGGDVNNLFTINSSGVFPPYSEPSMLTGSFYVTAVDNNLYLNYAAVPEPGSIVLIGVASIGFGWRRWRRKRSDAAAEVIVNDEKTGLPALDQA